MNIVFALLNYIKIDFLWLLFEILIVIFCIFIIRKFKISGQKVAIAGFIVLIAVILFSTFLIDAVAGKFAEIVFIIFSFSFIQEFMDYLRRRGK